METAIEDLFDRYERGSLTRRQLVQGLLLIAGPVAAQVPQSSLALRPRRFDHVAITVSDLTRSRQFYEKLFGVNVTSSADGFQLTLALADRPQHINLNAAGSAAAAGSRVGLDHFAIAVEDFTVERAAASVTRILPAVKVERAANSISFSDPDGVRVQIEPVR